MKRVIVILCVILMACTNIANQHEEPVIQTTSLKSIVGDINKDGVVNISDLTELIDALITEDIHPWYDVNGDGSVSVADITALIDILLTGTFIDDGIYEVNGVQFKMIPIKAGTFMMGSEKSEPGSYTFEKPRHEVTLTKDYMIGETEVTQELWSAVMNSNPSIFKGDLKRPVEHITWDECYEFITILNELTGMQFRLPTEAEWEYAALGGEKTHNYMFPGSSVVTEVAWCKSNSEDITHPVSQLLPNELGIYDMAGNVSEWCFDWYSQYPSISVVDPIGPENGTNKMYRGGNYNVYAKDCRTHFRYCMVYGNRYSYIGLRLAL